MALSFAFSALNSAISTNLLAYTLFLALTLPIRLVFVPDIFDFRVFVRHVAYPHFAHAALFFAFFALIAAISTNLFAYTLFLALTLPINLVFVPEIFDFPGRRTSRQGLLGAST